MRNRHAGAVSVVQLLMYLLPPQRKVVDVPVMSPILRRRKGPLLQHRKVDNVEMAFFKEEIPQQIRLKVVHPPNFVTLSRVQVAPELQEEVSMGIALLDFHFHRVQSPAIGIYQGICFNGYWYDGY